jgi:hypothetical protein
MERRRAEVSAMAQGLVVGIFPGTDRSAIESALTAAQIDLSKVTIVLRASAGSVADPDEWESNFIDVTEIMESTSFSDEMTKGVGIMADSGGTSVPGIGGHEHRPGVFHHHTERRNYVGSLGVPVDEADNFNTAIDEGRAVVAYPNAGADEEKVAAAFKSAGLRNVRSY